MNDIYNSTAMGVNRSNNVWQNFPWTRISLSFFMITTFLVFATQGSSEAETVASWTYHVGEIIVGTTIFSIATILMICAGRLLPKYI